MGAGPEDMSWVAAVHGSSDDHTPLGTAVVIDRRRLLTSAHVVCAEGEVRPAVWLAFPLTEDLAPARAQATTIRIAADPVADLAVLELAAEIPSGVIAAPLRCPTPRPLEGLAWWSFGFPRSHFGRGYGHAASGTIGTPSGYGWVRLHTDSRDLLAPGFSGGGLWCPEYRAVIGIVGAANEPGDGQAVTLHHADGYLHRDEIRLLARWSVDDADEITRTTWGWSLTSDQEADRHWRPRSRGVTVAAERGHRFRGRRVALSTIVAWLDRPHPDRKVLVVTGSPGVGKSAVLGRVVVSADAAFVPVEVPGDDAGPRATTDSVACAVHAKGKTAMDVAREIARAASAPLPEVVEDLPSLLRTTLAGRRRRRFNLVIDALDEASDAKQARRIIRDLVLPITTTCAEVNAQVVVATRRHDDGGDLVAVFGDGMTELDLDHERYFAIGDLITYAHATLQLSGDERTDNPYRDDEIAATVARRIGKFAGHNFLIAGLVARTHGLYDEHAVAPESLTFASGVEGALHAYLDRLPPLDDVPARDLMLALAYIDAPGVDAQLWQIATQALTQHEVTPAALQRFARTAAANFLVEAANGAGPQFRLFHQALNDALLLDRLSTSTSEKDHAALTRAFASLGRAVGWKNAPTYLFRSLPGHAYRGGLIDELLADLDYVLHADLRRLVPPAAKATTPEGQRTARMLQRTPQAIDTDPMQRLAMFTVTEALDSADTTYRELPNATPYRGRWAHTAPRRERTALEGHTNSVTALCSLLVDGRRLLASADRDASIRIWEPTTGTELQHLLGHTSGVNALCAVQIDGQEMLASAGDEHVIRIWNPDDGSNLQHLAGHTSWVNALCVLRIDDRELLVSGSDDRTVRIWDPVTGTELRQLAGHTHSVNAVCAVRVDGELLLASAGSDTTIQLWDPVTGAQLRQLAGHIRGMDGVNELCAVRVDGQDLLASAGRDTTIRIWDPSTGVEQHRLEAHTSWVNVVRSIQLEGRTFLVSAGDDSTIRLWDPITGLEQQQLEGHTDWINALCVVEIDDQSLLASAGADTTVRLWDPASAVKQHQHSAHAGTVNDLCVMTVDHRQLLVSASHDATIRLWNLVTGDEQQQLKGHTDWINAVCVVEVEGRRLIASAGRDSAVRLWDPATGSHRVLGGDTDWVNALCTIRLGEQTFLASASDDTTIRLWDPTTGAPLRRLEGHGNWVNALCTIRLGEHTFLASASADSTVRLWDPTSGAQLLRFDGHTDWVDAVCSVDFDGRTLLASAGADGTIRLWDPETGSQRLQFDGHTDWVNALCTILLPNGRVLLASAGADRTVRLWDPAHGALVQRIPVHSAAAALVSRNEDLFVGMASGVLVVRLEDLPTGRPSGR
jgi:WD40 repeat protein